MVTKVFEKPLPLGVPNAGGRENGLIGNVEKSLYDSLNRTKKQIYQLILANKWEYWSTQTFNDIKVDRYDLDSALKKYRQRLNNLKKNYYDFDYLLIPELHKDGAVHLHGFFMGIPNEKIIYSGYDYFNKRRTFKRKIYNWVDTLDFGFNDFLKLDISDKLSYLKMAKYCTKYITKDLIENRKEKRRFYSSQGLKKAIKYKLASNDLKVDFDKMNNPENLISKNSYYLKDKNDIVFNRVTEIYSLIGNYINNDINVENDLTLFDKYDIL